MQRAVPKIAKVELANTSVLIGMVKHKAGQFQKALTLFSDALPVQQKAYGKTHSIPGRTIFNMAVTYDELGDYKNCTSSLEQALSIQKSSLPPDHPDTLSTKMYQARIQSSAGKFDYALTALLGVLNSQKQLFGPKHPLVADTLHQIGICYARKGKMNSALKTYEVSKRHTFVFIAAAPSNTYIRTCCAQNEMKKSMALTAPALLSFGLESFFAR